MRHAVEIDLENRSRNLLPTAATEGGEDVAGGVQGGIGDGVQVFSNGDAHDDRDGGTYTQAGLHGQVLTDHVVGDTHNQPAR